MGSEQSSNKQSYKAQHNNYGQRWTHSESNTASAIIYERQRNPYSYAQTDLQNNVTRRPESMYPNLNMNNNLDDMYATNARLNSPSTGFVHVRTDIPVYPGQTTTSSYSTVGGSGLSGSTLGTSSTSAPARVPTATTTSRFISTTSRAPSVPTTSGFTSTPVSAPVPSAPTTAGVNSIPTSAQSPSAQTPVPSAPPHPRSASRNHRNKHNMYNCPTCDNRFGLEIFNCSNGHSSCQGCRLRGTACGICGLGITATRNFALQEFMAQLKMPCPNASDGCTLQIKTTDIASHALECPFADMNCPVNSIRGNCNWRGKSSQMLPHFNTMHPGERQGDVDTELILFNICMDSHNLYLIPMGPNYFIFHVKVDCMKRGVYMAVQLLGTGMSAAKWHYEVHIYNKREPRRKYMFVAPCTTASIPVNDLFMNGDCAVLALPYALTFRNDGVLNYKFFIKKIGPVSNLTNQDDNDDTRSVDNNYKPNVRGNWRGRGRGFNRGRGSYQRSNSRNAHCDFENADRPYN